MVCRDFILPEPASYVFFYAIFNLRNLLYIIITNGADVASVSEKLGHSDKAITLRMYTHADQESIRRASQIFRDALKIPIRHELILSVKFYRYGFLYGFSKEIKNRSQSFSL